MSEFDYIAWLRRQTPADQRVLLGPGDDAAVLRPAQAPWLVTTDMLLEGTHFRLADTEPRLIGRKAMAVNLSDIPAMAGRPVAAVVSVGLPQSGGGKDLAEALYLGMREIADAYATAIVGGDTNSWNGALVISVTLLGEASGRGTVTRSGAQPGDWLLVTGPLGGSILGKHLDFMPRVNEALALHELVPLHAMIDVSDGLAADLGHICDESGCGAVLSAHAIPQSAAAQRLQDGRSPLEHALTDGEDFELLLAVPPADGEKLITAQPVSGITLYHIGRILAEQGLYLEEGGKRRTLLPTGYVHRF